MTHHVLIIAASTVTPLANSTRYTGVGTCAINVVSNDETARDVHNRVAGEYEHMYVRISANTATSSSTFKFRKNAADGNQIITVGAGATGSFEDTSNHDTVAVGDLLGIQVVSGTVGTITIEVISWIFTPQNAFVLALNQVAGWDLTITANNASRFQPPMGSITANATESASQARYTVGAEIRNLLIHVTTNSRTTDTVVRTRKNGANGAQSFTVPAGQTGEFTDNTNIDFIKNTDLFNTAFVMGASAEGLVTANIETLYITTDHAYPIFATNNLGVLQSFNTTRYYQVGGGFDAATTEANKQVEARTIFYASGMFARVTANIITTTSTTAVLRINGASSALSMAIGAGATGMFQNVTNIVRVTEEDLINYMVATPNTSGDLTFTEMGIMALMSLEDVQPNQPRMANSVTGSQQATSTAPNMAAFQF